ncbi:MAG: hypothetical protein NTW08_00185 [Gammaproteobacteria bacterium]|nr:hypothetical protein [Gammaproteobacteria bacterium]
MLNKERDSVVSQTTVGYKTPPLSASTAMIAEKLANQDEVQNGSPTLPPKHYELSAINLKLLQQQLVHQTSGPKSKV